MRNLLDLDPDEFENLSLDLMIGLGLKNAVWRTPGRDGGRDIQGNIFSEDFSGHTSQQSWYIECKRYSGTVSWPTVWEKIAYADSNSADVLLIATTSTLSPQAIDEVNRWNDIRKKPHIRFWNSHDLLRKLRLFPNILVKYGMSPEPIRDAALSILTVSKILLKYSNTIDAYLEFGKPADRLLAVIQALSELISTRVEEIELFGKIRTAPFRASLDGYSWMTTAPLIESTRVDRYAMRAILSILNSHDMLGAPELQLQGTDKLLLPVKPLPDSLHGDLMTLAFWGSMNLNASGSSVTLERQDATR